MVESVGEEPAEGGEGQLCEFSAGVGGGEDVCDFGLVAALAGRFVGLADEERSGGQERRAGDDARGVVVAAELGHRGRDVFVVDGGRWGRGGVEVGCQLVEEPGLEVLGLCVDPATSGGLGGTAVVAVAVPCGGGEVLAAEAAACEAGGEAFVMAGWGALAAGVVDGELEAGKSVAVEDRGPAVPGYDLPVVGAVADEAGVAQDAAEGGVGPAAATWGGDPAVA